MRTYLHNCEFSGCAVAAGIYCGQSEAASLVRDLVWEWLGQRRVVSLFFVFVGVPMLRVMGRYLIGAGLIDYG